MIKIYPIRSLMSHGDFIAEDSQKLIDAIREFLPGESFEFIHDFSEAKSSDFVLILVQSGGSEGLFKRDVIPAYDGPYYLLTYGSSNSLAASLEILSYLRREGKRGEVLHGSPKYIAERIGALKNEKAERPLARLGILGESSDWLISSEVDPEQCEDRFGIELVKIPNEAVEEAIKGVKSVPETKGFDYDQGEIAKALQIYEGLKEIVKEYRLEGFTIRCFDLLKSIHSSACLALSLFNRDGIIGSCEGDVPALLTAYFVQKELGIHSFQANPQWVDSEKNCIEFAHCTLPLDMADHFVLDTHFESGIGVGIHGEMRTGPVTVVKLSGDLRHFYCEEGVLTANEYRRDRCRTQIAIRMDAPVSYFLRNPLGNHHQIIYGHNKERLVALFARLGLEAVR